LVQVSAEELVFRGYLQQALAARFSHPVIWLGLPSALFGAAHYMPQEAGDNAWLLCLWAMGFGLLMADLTARAGTLGPAIAVHFVNNIVALLILGSPSSLFGLALYLLPYEMSDVAALRPWLWVDCATMLVLWLVARLAIRR
jgi:membrane protease YdiL (CAAX protease family)